MMADVSEENEDNSLPYSDEEGSFPSGEEDDEIEDEPAVKEDPVAKLLEQLKNSGAIRKVEKVTPPIDIPFSTPEKLPGLTIKTEKGITITPFALKEPKCKTCDITFEDIEELHLHILEHVKLPFIVLERLHSDDEDDDEDNVDEWSDEEIEQEAEIPTKTSVSSDILKKLGGGISIGKSPNKETITISNPGDLKAIIKKVPLNDSIAASKTIEEAPASPIEKITTSGSLKLTIKQSSGKDFEVVQSSKSEMLSEFNVKKEPETISAPPITTHQTPTSRPTQPPPVVSQPASNRPVITETHGLPKNWDTVDTKDGILDSNLIKKEPTITEILNQPANNLPFPTTRIKDEPGITPAAAPPRSEPPQPIIPKPMIIPKKEPEPACAIIEINGDDSDNDDIMFVDSTPPIDKKPTIGLVPAAQITELPSPGFSTNQMNSSLYSTNSTIRTPNTPIISSGSTEKQHAFNWNAPSKPFEPSLSDKSTDSLFQSLLESHRKDSASDIGASEYISLDTLGPKHTCDVCHTRFTDLKLLDNHRKATGHSNQIVMAGSSGSSSSNALLPSSFGGNSSLMAMNNLLPVKQLAEVAGKLAGAGGSGFSHQQNIMVNIHSFPPQNVAPQMHGYAPQQMPGYQPGYRMPDLNQAYPYPQNNYPQYPPQPANPMGAYPNSQMPGGYPPNQYMPQQPPGYPNQYPPAQMPPTSMANMMGHQGGMMGQPPQQPGAIPTSLHDPTGKQSPNKMGVLGGIKIQNSQSPAAGGGPKLGPQAPRIAPGAVRGQVRMPMRGRGAVRGGVRMMRPGAPGQMIRGNKPMIRTPMKRPGEPANSPGGTPTKKRMDMLLPDRHDNEDCHVVSMQNKRDGVPLIESIKGRKESLQLGRGITVTKTRVRPPTPPSQKDASAVANMLAQRGIKITARPKSPSPPPVLSNLGSDIQIKKKSVSNNFHLPEDNVSSSNSLKCDMCHMSYSSFSQLQEHKRQFHSMKSEMGLPVVDLSNENNLIKLSNLGITNFIPLANREHGGGCFGIPVVSVHNALNGNLNTSLQSLGAGGILSLGPVKPLPKC